MITRNEIESLGWRYQVGLKNNNLDSREKHEVFIKRDLWFTRSLEADYIEIQDERKMLLEGFLQIPDIEFFKNLVTNLVNAKRYPVRTRYTGSSEEVNVPEEASSLQPV